MKLHPNDKRHFDRLDTLFRAIPIQQIFFNPTSRLFNVSIRNRLKAETYVGCSPHLLEAIEFALDSLQDSFHPKK